ncbi:hypothetical protein IKF88_00580 [Candidatus Saccharibacteria bacterium]|nr:hypothetical protein [Candidatus Saccharibacteria bacterium]
MKVNGSALGTNVAERESKSRKDANLQKWLQKFDDSWLYAQQNYHQRWERNWKLYHNIRVKRSHDGVVKTFVPMVNSTVNTLVAALFNNNPSVKYIPNHPDQEADTAVLNEIYDDFARKDNWVQKNKVNGKQGLITGNFACFYEWKDDKEGGYVHKEVVPIRDMIIDPQSHSYRDWRYVGRRYFASKKQLKNEKIWDFEKQKEVKRFKNLDDVQPSGSITDYESDKVKKDQAIGATAPGDGDIVECIEIWTRSKVVVIANRNTIIEEKENPYYRLEKAHFERQKAEYDLDLLEYEQNLANWNAERQMTLTMYGQDIGEYPGEKPEFKADFNEEMAGFLPFAHGRDYEDISLTYGDSDVDIIADQQELLNDMTELNIEAILYTLYPEKTLDPKYSTWANDLNPRPGKVYPIPAGAMIWNNPPTIPVNAFNERLNIKAEMREAVSVSEVNKGVAMTDKTTATEIKAQMGQADQRITEKAQTLANDFFYQEAKIVLKMLQLYAPDKLYVRTIDDANVTFEKVDMSRFVGEYTPMVTLDIQKRYEEAQQQQAYMDAFQMIIQDPTNNLLAAKQILYKKMMPSLTDEEIEQIITPVGAPEESTPVAVPDNEQQLMGISGVTPEEGDFSGQLV